MIVTPFTLPLYWKRLSAPPNLSRPVRIDSSSRPSVVDKAMAASALLTL